MLLSINRGTRHIPIVITVGIVTILVISIVSFLSIRPALAVTGTDWQAGNIIDDSVFTDNNSMSVGEIQVFLNSKVPACDTNGTQKTSSGITRAQYSANNGLPTPPYVCVRDYYENPTTHETNFSGSTPAGALSSAQIIKNAADTYKISPKVLLVLIQKESSILTDDWPYLSQYRAATGYGCPDTAACDSTYYGFYNQVTNAAKQFRNYLTYPDYFRYKPSQNNTIQWSPNSACGSSTVYIKTAATAALYNYTPYQPNTAALNNLYGTGDGCSAYGNRNFWRLFNDWFDRTTLDCRTDEYPESGVIRVYNPRTYEHFYTAYDCEAKALALKYGYKIEGVLHYQTNATSPYAVAVHRLYNPTTQKHLWATTQKDIDNATQNAGYRYEGVAFYAVSSEMPNHIAVHRLYNPSTYQHLWATTQEDIDNATQNAGYRYEGVAYYSAPPPQ